MDGRKEVEDKTSKHTVKHTMTKDYIIQNHGTMQELYVQMLIVH